MAREMLSEENLEQVVGGAFHYNTQPDGTMTCRVDGDKTYNCSSSAKNKISVYIVQHPDCSLSDIINYAKTNNLFW